MAENNPSQRFVSRITRNTLALILAGGRGTRLKQLTAWRVKPAVPFAGRYRIIDFTLSNCLNSGIRRIGVLTQYKADSLIRHIQNGWNFLRAELDEYIYLLPAQQRIQESWYKGTADAVYQNLDILHRLDSDYTLILAGDHVYKMDYAALLGYHVENGADLTIGCIEIPLSEGNAFGIMQVDHSNRVVDFVEKPESPPIIPGREDVCLASMGIYVFNTDFLFKQLIEDADCPNSAHDFGKDIIPSVVGKHTVYAYPFLNMHTGVQRYWRDVGTVDAYWRANMELIGISPELNLYDRTWPIWTYQEQTPPAKFVFDDGDRRGMAVDSMVSGGCVISGAQVHHSMLFSNVHVNSHSLIEDSVVLPNSTIGWHCRINRAIVDKGCKIPEGAVIGEDPEKDAKRFYVSPDKVVLVTPEMLGQKYRYAR